MALVRDLSKAQMAFQLTGRDVDQFRVTRFRGTEGLNQLYRFEIDLVASEEGLALESIVGKSAVLSVNTDNGARFFHGIVSRFEMSGETHDQTYFRAELMPAVWLLTHRYNSRIFQNKTIKDIFTDVLTNGGIPTDRFNMDRVVGLDEPREYTVQYRETDFNFISRLMEAEGIWYYFESTKEKHVMIMSSKLKDYLPIEGETKLPYRPATGLLVDTEHVYRFRMSQSVRPGAVVLTDYNFETPKLDQEAAADVERDKQLAFIDFPGKYKTPSDGLIVAANRAAEFEASRVVAVGQSNSKRLIPGKTFKLEEHPASAMNQAYVVTQLTHQGKESTERTAGGGVGRTRVLDSGAHQAVLQASSSDNVQIRELATALLQIVSRLGSGDATAHRALTQWLYHAGQVSRDLPSAAMASGASPMEWLSIPNMISDLAAGSTIDFDAPTYDCRFECMPASIAWMPPRVTPWPDMRGCQTARVVGPDGEEIHVDKFGRVKVQFHWDRFGLEGGQPKKFGADSSCFIRVSQGMAGGAYGMMFIPRIGQEVVVDFVEGDPDQPIIVGRVFNADHMPPYKLPDEKTKSVIKTNSTKDASGNNEIRFEDLKDKEQMFIQAQRQMDTHVKASHFHGVGGSYHLTVGGEKDGEVFGEYRQKVFKLKQTHVKEERRAWIEKDDSLQVDGNRHVAVGGELSVNVKKDVCEILEASEEHDVTGTYGLFADKILIEASSNIELKGPGGTITISGSGIHINGSTVYINSGAGPAVPGPGLAAVLPPAVDDPGASDSSKPGKDVHYTGKSATLPVLPPAPEVPGGEFPNEPLPVDATHTIDIDLVDEAGQPVVGEAYEIITPDGKKRQGRTDAKGHAKETGLKPGNCQVSFPRLDSEAWEAG